MRISSHSGGFNQQNHRSRGSLGPSLWGSRGHPPQSMPYGYQQRGPYPSQNTRYQAQNYGGYPQQMAPRDNFSSTWDQRPHGMQGTPQQGGGYDYYGRKGASGPTPTPSMGPPPQSSYNYGQSHAPDYANPPFPQPATQHGYGHGYEAHKYDNHGGHNTSQPGYTQQGHQSRFAPQQQYGKSASYGMPTQGPHSQTYGAPNQPGDTTYPGHTASAHYGSNVPAQQQYPYASGGTVQPTYPSYGSAPPSDGYSQAPSATAAGYAQQGTQPVPSYSQPAGQQAPGYAQAGTGSYGQYPYSQQGYTDQSAVNNANYGYQAPQDQSYGGGAGSTYGAPPSGQPGYAQPATTQPVYDQNAPQPGYAQPTTTQPAYGAAPGVAPVPYGKTVSPQQVYPQYDSAQMYAAPR